MEGEQRPSPPLRVKVANRRAVADAAGVSTATVSKALSGRRVAPTTLARVRAAAEALGYVPNEAARSMAGAPTMTVGIVLAFDLHPEFDLMAVVDRMIVDVQAHSYSAFLSLAGGPADLDTLLRRFVERRVDGLIYWNALSVPSLAAVRRAEIPVLAIGHRDEACADLPMLTVDSSQVYADLFARLAAFGHRTAVEIAPGQAADVHRGAAEAVGIEWRPMALGFARASAREFVASLGAPDSPTVVLAAYPSALQILAAANERGLEVPRDLSIVSTTDSPHAALLRTPLSAVQTDWARIGAASARAMLDALAGHELRDQLLPDGVQWLDRGSIGPVPFEMALAPPGLNGYAP